MPNQKRAHSDSERWGEFRLSVVGALLSSPPQRGELQSALKALSKRLWLHPITKEPVRYGFSTIECWYYLCRKEQNSPVSALRRKIRSDNGSRRVLDSDTKELIHRQYKSHKSWSYQLHAENIRASLKKQKKQSPCYGTIHSYMKSCGLFKQSRKRNKNREGLAIAEERLESREVRSYEAEYVSGLWHLDFHACSMQVLTKKGQWETPRCLAVMDDYSRLICHMQWYLSEDTQCLVHGFSQAVQRRGQPRELITDNGSAMTSAEFTEGLSRLGIQHSTTLPYSPYQNGKQERFFGSVEGRLIAMLENYKDLTLAKLNEATIAWVEMEYNRTEHREIKDIPLKRYINGKNVGIQSPSSKELRLAFRRAVIRSQRRNDATISVEGTRFEIPSRYRHLEKIRIHYAQWDLSSVHLVDKFTGIFLCHLYPLDKKANADGKRRVLKQCDNTEEKSNSNTAIAPLLEDYLAEYAATGLPPVYIPTDEDN